MRDKIILVVFIATVFLFVKSDSGLAGEEYQFRNVFNKNISRVYLSPNYPANKTIFAFSGNILYRSQDFGKSWSQIKPSINGTYLSGKYALYDLAFLKDGSILFSGRHIDGKKSFLVLSEDNGHSWEYVFDKDAFNNLKPIEGNHILGVSIAKKMLKASEDGGHSWNYDLVSNIPPRIDSVAIYDEKKYFVLDNTNKSENKLLVTSDGGYSWRDTGLQLQSASSFYGKVTEIPETSGNATIVACSPGTKSGIFFSRDGGSTWQQPHLEWIPKYVDSKIISVSGVPGGLIFAGTANKCILMSEDYGITWKAITKGVIDKVVDIDCVYDGNSVIVFAATPSGLLKMDYKKQQNEKPQTKPNAPSKVPSKVPVKFILGQKNYFIGGIAHSMDVEPFIEKNRTYMPIRYLGEALGAEIKWDESSQTVTLTKKNINVKFIVNKRDIIINGQTRTMDTVTIFRNNRTYLPARYVAEAFGYTVNWDSKSNSINVTEK